MAAAKYQITRAERFMQGWKECRRCKVMQITERVFCKDCGMHLATTPKTAKGKRHLNKLLSIKRY